MNRKLISHETLEAINDAYRRYLVTQYSLDQMPKYTKTDLEGKEPEYWTRMLVEKAIREIKSEGRITTETQEKLKSVKARFLGIKDGTPHFENVPLGMYIDILGQEMPFLRREPVNNPPNKENLK